MRSSWAPPRAIVEQMAAVTTETTTQAASTAITMRTIVTHPSGSRATGD
jgi:hypothetical protein